MPAVASTEKTTFRSGSEECSAVVVKPEGEGPFPCVVAAHGFGALKEGGPIRAVEYFAEHGYAGVAFDYRHWGESTGEPRELLDISLQHDDYRAAIEFARAMPDVDPEQIVLWGSSFSGGHIVEVAAGDPRVAAVISQAPHMNGIATLMGLPPVSSLKMTAAGLQDQAQALLGREPHYIPIVSAPGNGGVMSVEGALEGFSAIYDDDFEWSNRVAARIGLRVALYSPGRKASTLACPLLVLVCGEDEVTPPEPALKAAKEAPKGEIAAYAGLKHFSIYRGEPFERAMADQLEFLDRTLGSLG
jgi:fermentation-respiration switch protein FrsA (DUF1100 family)